MTTVNYATIDRLLGSVIYVNMLLLPKDIHILQNYFGDAWNVFDFIIVLGSFIDIVYSEVTNTRGSKVCFIQQLYMILVPVTLER